MPWISFYPVISIQIVESSLSSVFNRCAECLLPRFVFRKLLIFNRLIPLVEILKTNHFAIVLFILISTLASFLRKSFILILLWLFLSYLYKRVFFFGNTWLKAFGLYICIFCWKERFLFNILWVVQKFRIINSFGIAHTRLVQLIDYTLFSLWNMLRFN